MVDHSWMEDSLACSVRRREGYRKLYHHTTGDDRKNACRLFANEVERQLILLKLSYHDLARNVFFSEPSDDALDPGHPYISV